MKDAKPEQLPKISLLFELDRNDNPVLYDDLCRFIKGPRRANRLRFLANEGLRAEELRQAQSPQTHVSGEAVPGGIGLGAYGPAGDTNLVFASPLEE
ncbi:hypothetical protein [Aquabacterium sp.]|uniref:hypothetical protein n=1 Tax=Aquabacterium sp. TaxID=1872578 RepID=UPI004037BBED